MKLYLMRHAEAVDANFWGSNDATRPLSDLGIAKLHNGLIAMKKAGFAPAAIVASPFVRAQQTAEMASESLGLKHETVKDLSSGSRPDIIRKALLPYNNKPSLLVVGHMPDLAVFAARVADSAQMLDRSLQPGEIIYLDVPTLEEWGNGKAIWWRTLEDWKKEKN